TARASPAQNGDPQGEKEAKQAKEKFPRPSDTCGVSAEGAGAGRGRAQDPVPPPPWRGLPRHADPAATDSPPLARRRREARPPGRSRCPALCGEPVVLVPIA